MEEQIVTSPLMWEENLVVWVKKRLKENYVPILSSLVFGLLAYMFAFTNKLPNHDDLFYMFDKGATFISGRWGLELIKILFPDYSMPWIYGVLTLMTVTIAICLIISIFQIRNPLLQSLVSGCVMVSPALIGTFSYMFTASAYGVSFLLAVLAVFVLNRSKGKKFIPAAVLMILSLSIYQAYISIAASFFIIIMIQGLMQEKSTGGGHFARDVSFSRS